MDSMTGGRRRGRWEVRDRDAERRCAHWIGPNGSDPPVPGIGFRSADTLQFARPARDDRSQGGIGLVGYELQETGDLTATWVHPALGAQVGSGMATRSTGDPGGFAGTFRIVYYDAGGAPSGPVCALRIERTPAAWTLAWYKEADNRLLFEGVGLEAQGRLVCAWGPPGDRGELVVLRPGDAGSLRGVCVSMSGGTTHAESYVPHVIGGDHAP